MTPREQARAIDLKQLFQIRRNGQQRELRILSYILSRKKQIMLELCLALLLITFSKPETPLPTRSCRRLVWRPSNWSERRFRISRNLRFLEKDIVKLEKDIVTEQPNGKIQEYFVSDAYTKQGCFGSHIENDASWKPY